MDSSHRREAGRVGRRAKWLTSGAVALAVGATSALFATASPASAATGDVSAGTLNWAVKTSWNSYILNPGWGSSPAPASITPVAPSTTNFVFPASSGSVTSTTAGAVQSGGGVHWVLPAHGIDVEFDNIRVAVAGTHADIYADVAVNYATAMFGQPAGPQSHTNVNIATSDSASVSLAGTAATITVPGASIFGTAAGVAAGFPYGPGGADNNAWGETLTVNATVEGASTPTGAAIALSKSTPLNPNGETVHVTGTGFGPNGNAASPPLSGHAAGFYVAFGKYASPWQPSLGAPSANRKNGTGGVGLFWVVPQETYTYVTGVYGPSGTNPNAATYSQFVLLQPDGSFQLDLTVAAVQGQITATTPGTYGVYTYGANQVNNAALETFTPLSFAASASTGTETITAEIVHSPGGALTWTIPNNNPVALSAVVDNGTYLQATGSINPVTVTDTRTFQTNAWTLSGQVGNFTGGAGSIDGKYLGWSPKIVTAGAGITAGSAVASGWDSGNGLKTASVLGSAADGHAAGSGSLGADLTLKVPAETPAGSYTAPLTLTVLG